MFAPFSCSLRYFCHSHGKIINTENQYQRNGVTIMTIPAHMLQKALELICERNLEKFGDTG
jgi:hypothetical protein